MNGFIYVMSNEAFAHNLIKIGKSKHDPTDRRANQLYTTGVPEKFKVEYYAFVKNFDTVETRVHRALDSKRYRSNREFFTCSVPEAISLIRRSASVKYEEVFYQSPEEIERYNDALRRRDSIIQLNDKKRDQYEAALTQYQARRGAHLDRCMKGFDDLSIASWLIAAFVGWGVGAANPVAGFSVGVGILWVMLHWNRKRREEYQTQCSQAAEANIAKPSEPSYLKVPEDEALFGLGTVGRNKTLEVVTSSNNTDSSSK